MTSIIKNQLIKHLSKFARNLKPEQISLDVLKGKSELRNIELNEDVLTEVLELPIWMRIKKAHCNRVAVRVPWTKLSSSPVELFIDEITVYIVLSADRSPSTSKSVPTGLSDSGSYGFADKIVESMSLYVNTLEINFDSGAFGGSFMLSRLSVESKTPGWQPANNLKKTRLSCPTKNQTLVYKQVSWQLLRIEASARTEDTQRRNINAPLRLITSGGKIRISLKKNSTNGSVINARIMMILEEILWVATLPQIRSAIAFYSHMINLINLSKKFVPPMNISTSRVTAQSPDLPPVQSTNSAFRRFDIDQTSYHLQVKKIDLHLCDDTNTPGGYPENWDIDSGAMQVTLHVLLIDVYPRTLASSNRSHWVRYSTPNSCSTWMTNCLRYHFSHICDSINDAKRVRLLHLWPDLMSFNVVMRIYDISIQGVSDMNTKKDQLKDIFTSDRNSKKSLPSDQYILHVEFANFFHPNTEKLPVPPPATYCQLGPFSLIFDQRTLRWCLFVIQNLQTALIQANAPPMDSSLPPPDFRIDLLMPKISIPLNCTWNNDSRLPKRLIISLSTVTLSNDFECPNYERLNSSQIDYLLSANIPLDRQQFSNDMMKLINPNAMFEILDGEHWWLKTSPIWIDTDYGEFSKGVPLISDISIQGSFIIRPEQVNVYIEPLNDVTAHVDHFQLLQLTRLADEISNFVELLSKDNEFFSKSQSQESGRLLLFTSLSRLNVNLILTSGPIPSPYESHPTIFLSETADCASERSRSTTPVKNKKVSNDQGEKSVETIRETISVDEYKFKEFPTDFAIETDLVSNLDDTMSIRTDISDDDNSFAMPDILPEEELFATADIAMEACYVDSVVENDRQHQSLMAKQVNVLTANINAVNLLLNVFEQNLKIMGQVVNVSINPQLNMLRSVVYSNIAKHAAEIPDDKPMVVFELNSPAKTNISLLQANISGLGLVLEEEVLNHLSAFIADDAPTPNKIRMQLNIKDSKIEIKDAKKAKPLRLSIKECLIEQDED